jgi:hypothetical protein
VVKTFGKLPVRLDGSPAGYQVDDQNNHGDYEQQVDEAATNVREQANQPQDQQNHQNCPQHDRNLLLETRLTKTERGSAGICNEQRSCQPAGGIL